MCTAEIATAVMKQNLNLSSEFQMTRFEEKLYFRLNMWAHFLECNHAIVQ